MDVFGQVLHFTPLFIGDYYTDKEISEIKISPVPKYTKILKQLFASGLVIIGEYSPRLRLGEWVVPEKIHTPPTEEISAVWSGGREKKLFLIIVNVLFRTSEGGRGVNFLFPLWGWYGCFLE
jgi:hypothetical protein